MTTVSFNSRQNPPPEDKVFIYSHNAKSWLLLAGYLPQTEDPKVFVNVYTGDVATIKVER